MLNDEKIDTLLDKKQNKKYLDCLKRLRNGIFHYQKEVASAKVYEFINLENSQSWINKLKSAFNDFFLRAEPSKSGLDRLVKNLKDDS